MRKASRLFEIIQILRLAQHPVTAAQMAESLGVVPRSIYRDVAALQAMQVPVEGDRGIGYMLRAGFTLPPLMFGIEEMEAIVLALALLERTGDTELRAASRRVSRKIAAAVPPPLREILSGKVLHAWGATTPAPEGIDLADLRRAIRLEQKLAIAYCDEEGRSTQRVIWPLAVIYYAQGATLVGWCELRQALRNFRVERVQSSLSVEDFFRGRGDELRQAWISGWGRTGTPGSG